MFTLTVLHLEGLVSDSVVAGEENGWLACVRSRQSHMIHTMESLTLHFSRSRVSGREKKNNNNTGPSVQSSDGRRFST